MVPITCVVAAALLLVAVMVESRRHNVPAWKHSQLAALLALDLPTRQRVETLSEAQVGDVPVRLGREGEGEPWRLRGPANEEWWEGRFEK